MTITFRCESCGKGYRVGDDKGGKRMRCSNCETVNEIPAAEDDFGDLGEDDEDDYGSPVSKPAPLGQPRKLPARQTAKGSSKPAKTAKSKGGNQKLKPILLIASGAIGFVIAFSVSYYAVRAFMSRGGGGDTSLFQYVPSTYVGGFVLQPENMLKTEAFSPQVRDEIIGKIEQLSGVSPHDMEFFAVMTKRLETGKTPNATATMTIARFTKPVDTDRLVEWITSHTRAEEASHNGKSYQRLSMVERMMEFTKDGPKEKLGAELPPMGAYMPDARNIIIAPEPEIKSIIEGNVEQGPLSERFKEFGTTSQLTAVFLVDQSRDTLRGAKDVDFQVPGLSTAASLSDRITTVAGSFDFDARTMMVLELDGNDTAAAELLQTKLDELVTSLKKFVDEAVRDNPLAKFPGAMGNLYGEYVAIMRKVAPKLTVSREGERVTLTLPHVSGLTKVIDELSADLKGMYVPPTPKVQKDSLQLTEEEKKTAD